MNIQIKSQVLAARVNHKVESLNFLIFKPKNIEFIDATVSAGMRVYERSISMVMAKAVKDLFPRAVLKIEHPISKGVFCKISSFRSITEDQVQQLKNRMQEIIDANLPIYEEEKQTSEVIRIFRKGRKTDTVRLLETLKMPYTRYFRIEDYTDYYSGVLAPSTAYLKVFDLQKYQNGILLRIPNKINPQQLEEVVPQPKLFDVFNEYIKWNKIIGLSNVGDFNVFTQTNKIQGIMKISEALHEKKIVQIVEMICRRKSSRFILISGPSSSGKTTFSKRLALQLSVMGIKPIMLSLDNYFVNRKDTPLDENGDWDFEHLNALDLPLFNQQLKQLLAGEEVEIPFYNFELGIRQYRGEKLKLNKNNVLLIEGIHALNPALLSEIPEESKFKIYVSALTTISLDSHNRLATTDTRLLRRIIRDYKFRNYSAQETIAR
jgi:uridine kinase